MSARLRSDLFVAAYLRRCAVEGAPAMLRRRGAAEAGAIYIKIDRLDGEADLYGPAPPMVDAKADLGQRRFEALMLRAEAGAVEARMRREATFDSDLWLVEVEDRAGRNFFTEGETD